jgi:D-isomer specific 2-hydroxyacid dehydrogenase, NAD binding domain
MIINTSRGALVDASAVIEGLKSEQIDYLGLDVYEQEADLFYEKLSERIIQDDVLQRLVTFPNVIVTSHQAYFTDRALENISNTTIANLTAFERGTKSLSRCCIEQSRPSFCLRRAVMALRWVSRLWQRCGARLLRLAIRLVRRSAGLWSTRVLACDWPASPPANG